jgi:excisionase family DNA binding protein
MAHYSGLKTEGAGGRFLTISEVAEFVSVSERTVHRWIKQRALPVHRFGSVVRISNHDLSEFLLARRTPT